MNNSESDEQESVSSNDSGAEVDIEEDCDELEPVEVEADEEANESPEHSNSTADEVELLDNDEVLNDGDEDEPVDKKNLRKRKVEEASSSKRTRKSMNTTNVTKKPVEAIVNTRRSNRRSLASPQVETTPQKPICQPTITRRSKRIFKEEPEEHVVQKVKEETSDVAQPLPKEETQLPKEEMQLPKEETQLLKEETQPELVQQQEPKPMVETSPPINLIDEKKEYLDELKYWRCVCLTLDDWQLTQERYMQSKRAADQHIAKLISENYLQEMPALFLKQEKDRQQRLIALAPKRQSQRLLVQGGVTSSCQTDVASSVPGRLNDGDDYNSCEDLQYLDETSQANDLLKVPLTEQERLKKDEIAKQREGLSCFFIMFFYFSNSFNFLSFKERLRQRLLRRELNEGATSSDNTNQND